MHTRSWLTIGAMLLTALGCGNGTDSPSEPTAGSSAVTVSAATALAFWQVSAGFSYSCGVTTDHRAYCWGYNLSNQLGDGTTTQRLRPVPVGSALPFRQIEAGPYGGCAITTDYRLFCWGVSWGERPVAVAGNLRFRQVSVGGTHACAVRYDDRRAYCWGQNSWGELGDGTTTSRWSTPGPVAGARRFRRVTAGDRHTCGLTTNDEVFCWGWNRYGQIGIGDDASPWVYVLAPTRIISPLRFRDVAAGLNHTCAVATDYRAFCWGNGRSGQVGDGKTYLRFAPRRVAGGLLFRQVTGGRHHTCAVTRDNQAYCWGGDYGATLGDGEPASTRLKPGAVRGGLSFKQLSAGYFHTCGKTTDDVGYCWGLNEHGELGDGTTNVGWTPTPVAGPM